MKEYIFGDGESIISRKFSFKFLSKRLSKALEFKFERPRKSHEIR